ncbi:MAG TPA: AI-2E family transporter [Solirubrobacteraceae bacterium]|nr:AI-2E family transporter [Solirubrobacteraceae bacterium]
MAGRRAILRGRIHRQRPEEGARHDEPTYFVDLEPGELSGVFAAPGWLRDCGVLAWLLVGISLLLVAAVTLLALINTIVIPVVTATIIAAVCAPLVRRLARHMPRAMATVVVFLSLLGVGIAVILLVLGGIVSQASTMQATLQKAVDKVESALHDAGVSADKAQQASSDASSTVSDAFHALVEGLGVGISALASLAVFLSFTALSLFFLLKDGPQIRAWTERHTGLPPAVARMITGRTLGALQGYFAGVTAIAAFNAIVIGLGAVVLGLPQVGSIMLVNFFAAYVPYLGAWSAGAFTVLIALGSKGSDAAIVMGVVVLLANGALQQMIQPIAFGATLGIHPLAVLIVTIAGGALFGTIGLILAAPVTSAIVHISADLARARAQEKAAEPPAEAAEAPA